MQKRKLASTDMEITTCGFGAWAAGGGNWEWGWGAQDDAESVAAIQKGLDLGINWIDTAAAYGLGHSEEIVRKALKGRHEKVFIATKCGLVWDDPSTGTRLERPSGGRKQLAASGCGCYRSVPDSLAETR